MFFKIGWSDEYVQHIVDLIMDSGELSPDQWMVVVDSMV